uniref:Putative serine/threonine-protein phosphatase 4 regulatory subunit 2-A n=1 Tax=Davidia involucrata TaxID=16924 RepID=A0A5B7BE76_DAVIN
MDTSTNENSEHSTISPSEVDQNHDNLVSDFPNHGGMESKHEFAEEEVRGILEVIAATGKFWHEWDKLKSMLSFYLKQVLSKYSEAKMTSDQQNSTLGEAYSELAKRLDDALQSFAEGPPFTLQRLCEILLTAENIYPNLSKLALALEKNLLVTSTLTISTDPYPPTIVQRPDEPEKGSEEPQLQSTSVQNGVEPIVGDRDEIMTEVEEVNVDDDMTIDMETFEEIVGSSESNSVPTGHS